MQFLTKFRGLFIILVNVGNHHYFTNINLSFLHSLVHGFILFSASEVREQTHIFKGQREVEKVTGRLRFWHESGFLTKINGFYLILVNVGNHPCFNDINLSFFDSSKLGLILFPASEAGKQTHIVEDSWSW